MSLKRFLCIKLCACFAALFDVGRFGFTDGNMERCCNRPDSKVAIHITHINHRQHIVIPTVLQLMYRVRLAKWLACLPLMRLVAGSHPGLVIPKTIIKMVQTASLHMHACVGLGV